MTSFTPLESGIGAILLQIASTSYIYSIGEPLGFSSIIYNSLTFKSLQSASVFIGVVLSSIFSSFYLSDFVSSGSSNYLSNISLGVVATAGFLVGMGTSYGSGCTSGHMIGGISRLRVRSIVATMVFFIAAVVLTYFIYTPEVCYISGSSVAAPCYQYDENLSLYSNNKDMLIRLLITSFITSYIVVPVVSLLFKSTDSIKPLIKTLIGLNAGFWFGLGLSIAGMTNPAKVLGFLSFTKPQFFDPSLAMIILLTIIPNVILWNFVSPLPKTSGESISKKTLLNEHYSLNFSSQVPPRFIFGNLLFGLGWGLVGVCPGPGIANLFLVSYNGLVWMFAFVVGYSLTKINNNDSKAPQRKEKRRIRWE